YVPTGLHSKGTAPAAGKKVKPRGPSPRDSGILAADKPEGPAQPTRKENRHAFFRIPARPVAQLEFRAPGAAIRAGPVPARDGSPGGQGGALDHPLEEPGQRQ